MKNINKKIKILLIIVTLFIIHQIFISNVSSATEMVSIQNTQKKGDLNNNGTIDMGDIIQMLRHISASSSNSNKQWILSENNIQIADINKNSKVDIGDIMSIIRYWAAINNKEIAEENPEWLNIVDDNNKKDENKQTENKQAENKQTENKQTDNKQAENKQTENKQTENKQIDNKQAENKQTENKQTENKQTENKQTENKKTENKKTDNKQTENKQTENKKTENKQTENKKTDNKQTENKKNNNKTDNKKPIIKVTNIFLNKTKLILKKGQTFGLKATVKPSNASSNKVSWTSSKPQVATVDKNGKITAKKAGKAIITVNSTDGSKVKAICNITVKNNKIKVTRISLNKSKLTLKEGQTFSLKATIKPSNASSNKVSWTSSKPQVATVDKIGNITAKKAGKTEIKVKSTDGSNKIAICKVTVKQIDATRIDIKQKDKIVPVGTNLQLEAIVLPKNASNKKVKWTSSNNKIATVSNTGKVHGIAIGKVTITATTHNGKKDTCIIRVNIPAKSISLNPSNLKIFKGNTATLNVVFNPKNTSSKEITWASSNSDIVTIPNTKNSTITITAKKEGTATITATSKYGLTARCTINVSKTSTISSIENETTKAYNGKIVTKAQLANFRNVYAGNLGTNNLYRCIDPIKGRSSRKTAANYADQMLKEHHVNAILNLCDNSNSLLKGAYSDSPYYKSLYNSGKVYAKHMDVNSSKFQHDITKGLKLFVQKEGPYAVHCYVGRDRTGFTILLLECLMNAPYNYMYNDFVTSFKTLNLIGRSNSSEKSYNKDFSKYLKRITGKSASNSKHPKSSDWKNVNFVRCAEKYLKNGGMSDSEIAKLKNNLSKNH